MPVPDADYFDRQAKRCRRLARQSSDEATASTLSGMADEYEAQARQLRGAAP